jgi:hypothetical protein
VTDPEASKNPKEPSRGVDLDVIAVTSFASGPSGLRRKLRAPERSVNGVVHNLASKFPCVHMFSSAILASSGHSPTSLRGLARLCVQVEVGAAVRSQVEATGDQLSVGDHVVVRRSPDDLTGRSERDRLELGLEDDVIKPR